MNVGFTNQLALTYVLNETIKHSTFDNKRN